MCCIVNKITTASFSIKAARGGSNACGIVSTQVPGTGVGPALSKALHLSLAQVPVFSGSEGFWP